ncbi:hypothetical protein [Brevundimonas sp. Root1279]|uniref:hypothetical protein n=1 Tax=Brevundimonas sp. Root1279 TaxID=1736443 RepID=UPI000702314C|nr:hypothetical protein [Brevundimonas sp. Root1279]KQW80743.1 hypothetical protein ASC65_12255 [Brevundimonas sp. Root1279]
MAQFQLRCPAYPVVETIDAEDLDQATDQARMRLLFCEPGFEIVVYQGELEVSRLVQAPKRPPAWLPRNEQREG